MAEELVRSGKLENVHIGLDYFDASVNRVGAWATGARSMRKALLFALLEPHAKLVELEASGNGYAKMGMLEALHTLPFGAVWNRFCEKFEAPDDFAIIEKVAAYEKNVLKGRQ